MALATIVDVRVKATLTSPLDIASRTVALNLVFNDRLATGTGADQADLLFTDTRTLAASATENLDLAGVLTDGIGNTLTFARIKCVVVTALAANTNDVKFERHASAGPVLFTAVSAGVNVKPGGCFLWYAPDAVGVAVTATTADMLTVTNGGAGTAVTYSIVVIGASV